MLVRFTDHEDRETWVNPIHVRLLRTWTGMLGGKKGTEVWFSFNHSSEAIYIDDQPANIAARLNAAMPTIMLPPSDEDSISDGKTPTGE
jgi:hypothetical protein